MRVSVVLVVVLLCVSVLCSSPDQAFSSMQRAVSEMRDASGRPIVASRSPIAPITASTIANAEAQSNALMMLHRHPPIQHINNIDLDPAGQMAFFDMNARMNRINQRLNALAQRRAQRRANAPDVFALAREQSNSIREAEVKEIQRVKALKRQLAMNNAEQARKLDQLRRESRM
eukprot:TRINITY_DN754_c0_g1_i1.p1 TRINITY_DN754_c0_g1~~TRINITY_DN754_c0_g1_i1.p1  ORF type:complete len:197 (+),score=30.56 TRINITY_DN754_c0_g1_i1:70-591(+)